MSKDYLIKLRSKFKEFAKIYGVLDIILYGSSVKGKLNPQDLDLLLIFNNLTLKERLDTLGKFKKLLSGVKGNFDVKTINLIELFDKNLLSRQGILIEGYSLINDKILAESLGFKGFSLFSYRLGNLDHNDKTKFTYALIGRKGEGIIKKLGADHIGKGAILVPIENSIIFVEFLDSWKLKYKKKDVLISSI
ncbi:MAG: nucleotidyltransferase domain-containing protein [Nanoarchaeota archaeon]|nr:nucleotidyltransferase domain-containing protein [Nanoarchaeota archaeon]